MYNSIFQPQAFAELANIKYSQNPSSYKKLIAHVSLYDGPVIRGTIASSSGVFNKLTDTSLYTGSHKHRFDKDGNGKGLEGRVEHESRTNSLSQLVDRSLSIIGAPGKKASTPKKVTTPKKPSTPKKGSTPKGSSSLPDVFSRLTDSKVYMILFIFIIVL
jgi:hypothetical protein